jgi:FAD binding domain
LTTLGKYGLTFGPDPATHKYCTLGGMIGNNSCGMHAQMAGPVSNNVESLEILTYDGTRMTAGWMTQTEMDEEIGRGGRVSEILSGIKALRLRYESEIRGRVPSASKNWPTSWSSPFSTQCAEKRKPCRRKRSELARPIMGFKPQEPLEIDPDVVAHRPPGESRSSTYPATSGSPIGESSAIVLTHTIWGVLVSQIHFEASIASDFFAVFGRPDFRRILNRHHQRKRSGRGKAGPIER